MADLQHDSPGGKDGVEEIGPIAHRVFDYQPNSQAPTTKTAPHNKAHRATTTTTRTTTMLANRAPGVVVERCHLTA